MSKKLLMQGNEAAVEGAIAAGMRFFAGYPITPSTEIAETCALRLPQEGGKFIQMEDELASIAAVLGASAAGMKAMTATSGPGFSLMQENIGYGAMAEIPCVIVDPVIALSPASVRETYTLIIRAFNLAEKYRTPVIFLMDEIVGHMREGVELPDPHTLIINQRKMSFHDGANKQCYFVPEGQFVPAMKPFGQGERYNITGLAHDESGFPVNSSEIAGKLIGRLLDKVEKNADDICRVEELDMDDAETAIVCFGGTTRAVRDALSAARAAGKKVGMFRPVTVWPFPEKQLLSRLGQLKKVLVVEHNHGQMLLEVRRTVGGALPVDFLGRIDGTVISPEDILAKLEETEGSRHAE